MNLKDVIDQISSGELSNVFTFDDDVQTISADSRRKLIPQVNLGLQLLHQRFFLKEKTEIVNMVDSVYTYPLTSKDILRIEQVHDVDNNEYCLDVEDEPESFLRKNLTTLQAPTCMDPKTLVVTYRANANMIQSVSQYVPPENVAVDLPMHFMEPLVLFIASRFLNPMGASDGFHEGNNYAAKYEAACRLLENQNYDLDRQANGDRFRDGGWV